MWGILRARDERIRTVWRLLVFVVGLVALAVGMSYGFGWVLRALGMSPPRQLLSWKVVTYYAVLSATWFVWVGLCRRFMDHRTVASLGLSVSGQEALAAGGGGLLGGGLVFVGVGILFICGGYEYAGIGRFPAPLAPAATFVFAAFAEEITCRGYMLQNLRDIGRPVLGVLLSSAVFSIFHTINPAMWSSFLPPLNLFLTGILLALAYIASGNIWFPTALHYGWNLVEGPVLGTRVSGIAMEGWLNFDVVSTAPGWLTGGGFGLEGSVVATGVQCTAICGFLIVLWRSSSEGPPGQSCDEAPQA